MDSGPFDRPNGPRSLCSKAIATNGKKYVASQIYFTTAGLLDHSNSARGWCMERKALEIQSRNCSPVELKRATQRSRKWSRFRRSEEARSSRITPQLALIGSHSHRAQQQVAPLKPAPLLMQGLVDPTSEAEMKNPYV